MDLQKSDLAVLEQHCLFHGVKRELMERALLGGDGWVCSFAPGEVIHSPEDREQIAGILISGKAAVSTPNPGNRLLLKYLHPGDMFGIANFFSKVPYVSVITAEKSCRCICFRERAVRFLLDESAEFREHYIGFLSGRVRYLNRKIGYLTASGAEGRLALYLISFGKETVELSESISSLSELLNLSRASLYRAFDCLCDHGYLIKDGKKLTLTDPQAMLAEYCSQ